jgi:hypothetical protein
MRPEKAMRLVKDAKNQSREGAARTDRLSSTEVRHVIDALQSRMHSYVDALACRRLHESGVLVPMLSALLLKKEPTDQIVSQLDPYIRHPVSSLGMIFPRPFHRDYKMVGVSAQLETYGVEAPDFIRSKSICIIGGGPAGMLTLQTLMQMGFENVVVVDNSPDQLGIWKQKNVVRGGINNPRNASAFNGMSQLVVGDRQGQNMVDFLEGVKPENMEDYLLRGMVTGITQQGKQTLVSTTNKEYPQFPVDLVFLCTGTGKPLDLHDPQAPMKTEIPESYVQRWQHELKNLDRYKGKTIVCVGLGNSTAEMMRQVHEINESLPSDEKIKIRVLTHYGREAVLDPTKKVHKHDGTKGSIFRKLPEGIVVDYAGDIPALKLVYDEAMVVDCANPHADADDRESAILDSVKEWGATKNDDKTYSVWYTCANGTTYQIENVSEINALVGYANDETLMEKLGCKISDTYHRYLDLRAVDNRVKMKRGISAPVYAVGAAGVRRDNQSCRTIPGILYSLPEVMVSAWIDLAKSSYSLRRE